MRTSAEEIWWAPTAKPNASVAPRRKKERREWLMGKEGWVTGG
jgi:hypothetical protein